MPDYGEIITMLVGSGDPPTTFIVHKDKIVACSKFVLAASSKAWIEGQQKTIKLPEEDPRYFKVYVHWIYTGNVNLAILGECSSLGKWEEHIQLYLIASRLDDVSLRNRIINLLIDT